MREEDPPQVMDGPLVKMSTRRFDSLRALPRDDSQLVMSDLRPMVLSGGADPQGGNFVEDAMLYPFARIVPDASLLLYFEIYHLGLGRDGRGRYLIEYEVQRRTEGEGIRGLFGGADEQSTSTKTTYTTNTRSTEEFILLDLGEWKTGREGRLNIIVRVTDETTGQQAERLISFEV